MEQVSLQEELALAIRERDVKSLCRYYFNFSITEGQAIIIRKIAYAEHPRLIINCMTQYGKTRAVSLGVCLYFLFNEGKRVALLGPTYNQTGILRNYVAELISDSPVMWEMIDQQTRGVGGLKRQLSKNRITFNNGCVLMVLSAEGSGNRLLGFGADYVIVDESCSIKKEVHRAKISRMLGSNRRAIFVEISNPTTTDSQYYDDWNDPLFERIHIDYVQALREERVTKEFIEEQRRKLTPMEFRILYESRFPTQSEDSVFDTEKIDRAIKNVVDIQPEYRIIACDPADKGRDLTVIMLLWSNGDRWVVKSIYSEAKSEQTNVAGRILRMTQEQFIHEVKIDYGMGAGIISMVRAGLARSKTRVSPAVFGSSPIDKKRFLNRKAEMYFWLADMFNTGRINIPAHPTLIKELLSIKWEHSMGGKIKIIDPEEKSPDFADALVIGIWKTVGGVYLIS